MINRAVGRSGSLFRALLLLAMLTSAPLVTLVAQVRQGEVIGILTGGVHKYSGEFTDDLWGAGGFASIQYAPLRRLHLEARFGLGEIRWKISPSDLARYPGYFGRLARIGTPYPGTLTTIEAENESRLTTLDLLVHWVLFDHLRATPFISAGIGWVSYAPSNASEHDALPNFIRRVYSGNAVSVPVGAGVRIPISHRVDLMIRGEHRFVFSKYLDDLNANGMNDAVSSASVGFTYRFNDPDVVQLPEPEPQSQLQPQPQPEPQPQQEPQPQPQPPVQPSTSGTSISCPDGHAVICVDSGLAVCADTMFTPGRSRIKWEEGMVYDPSSPDHLQSMNSVSASQPCYALVVREVEDAYYLCVDCCFEQTVAAGSMMFNLIPGSGRIVKGQGEFDPSECKDCSTITSSQP